jgi:hypothetical protein
MRAVAVVVQITVQDTTQLVEQVAQAVVALVAEAIQPLAVMAQLTPAQVAVVQVIHLAIQSPQLAVMAVQELSL